MLVETEGFPASAAAAAAATREAAPDWPPDSRAELKWMKGSEVVSFRGRVVPGYIVICSNYKRYTSYEGEDTDRIRCQEILNLVSSSAKEVHVASV